MSGIRQPVAAGTFYPRSAEALASTVDELVRAVPSAGRRSLPSNVVRGLIVPHAGYVYSGPVAATAYALLEGRPAPSVTVILGPSHFVPLQALAASPRDAWRTPLGDVPVDATLRSRLVAGGSASDEAPHLEEHSIEVQLPFLQRCLPGTPILPLAVGRGSPEAGATALDASLEDQALLLVSTDLSHYHPAATARQMDQRTATNVEALAVDELRDTDACGVDALRVALTWARQRGHDVVRLDLRNSADTAGSPDRVVGYGAFAIVEPWSQTASTT